MRSTRSATSIRSLPPVPGRWASMLLSWTAVRSASTILQHLKTIRVRLPDLSGRDHPRSARTSFKKVRCGCDLRRGLLCLGLRGWSAAASSAAPERRFPEQLHGIPVITFSANLSAVPQRHQPSGWRFHCRRAWWADRLRLLDADLRECLLAVQRRPGPAREQRALTCTLR